VAAVFLQVIMRVGEASNPGPEKILFSANPSSIRGKMLDILEYHEEGTWGFKRRTWIRWDKGP
jgi:hypothetical protein